MVRQFSLHTEFHYDRNQELRHSVSPSSNTIRQGNNSFGISFVVSIKRNVEKTVRLAVI